MQIVGQIIKGTVTVVDVYGKEQTLGKGQTIVLGDTVKAKSEDALILFDNNPEPVIIAGNTAIEIDDDFLAYLTDQAKKAQEGVETTLAEEVQNDDLQVFMDSEDESFLNDNTLTIENSSINSIELFDANIQGIDFNHEVAAEEKAPESNIQFSLVGEDGQYYVRGSDTETLMVIEHARDGTLSRADDYRHFEVLGLTRGSVPVETINTVLHHTRLDLQGTEDVPAVVQDVIDSLETWQTAGDLDAHDMTVLGIDHGTIHVTNINEALKNSDFYSTGTIDSFYPDTENIIATLQALQNGTAVSNEQLQDLGVLSSTQALSEGELGYLRTLMSDLTPSSDAYLTELTTQSNHLYTTAEAPTSINLLEASDSGTSNEDNITKDNTPTVTIGLPGDVTPGIDTLNVHIRNHDTGKTETYRQTITQAEIDNGKVDITFLEEMIVDGHYTLSATITDSRGYTSTIQNIDINVDLKATVTVDTIAEDDIINAQEYEKPLTISGTSEDVEAGQKLTVTLNNHTYETTVQNNGKWQVTVPLEDIKGLEDKHTYAVSVNVTDLAGNEAVLETPHILRVNTSAEITIDKITGDNIINAQEHLTTEGVEIHGTTTGIEEGQRVTVLIKDAEGNTVFTHSTAVSNVNDEEKGSWSYTIAHSDISGLSHTAAYTVEVLASDASGNEAPSVTQDIVIDIKADSDDNLGITLSDASDLYEENKTLSHDDQTNDKSPEMGLSGIDADVKTVTVTFTDSANPPHTHPVSATQSDDGKWTLPVEVLPGFQDGEITATVTVVDHVGNEDTASTTFTLDTRADNDFDPEVNDGLALSIALSDTSDNNDVNAVYNEEAQNGDKQTNDKSPQMDLSGIDLDVQTVTVTFTDSANHTQTVAATKNDDKTTWTLPAQELTDFQDGVVTAIVTVADDANNTSTASTTFTLDTSADTGEPLSLTLSTEADTHDFDNNTPTGTDPQAGVDEKTNDKTPTLTLTGVDADISAENIYLYEGDTLITAEVTANGNGTYSITPTEIVNDGTHTFTVRVIDDAGNPAEVSNTDPIIIDTLLTSVSSQREGNAFQFTNLVEVIDAEKQASGLYQLEVTTDKKHGTKTIFTATYNAETGNWDIKVEGGYEVAGYTGREEPYSIDETTFLAVFGDAGGIGIQDISGFPIPIEGNIEVTTFDAAGNSAGFGTQTLQTLEDNPLIGKIALEINDTIKRVTIGDDSLIFRPWKTSGSIEIENIGRFAIDSDGTYNFTPVDDYNGQVPRIDYITIDGDSGSLDITVTAVNDAPEITSVIAPVSLEEDSAIITGTVTSSDVDDNATAMYSAPATAGFSIDATTGAYSFNPSDDAYQHLSQGQQQTLTIPITVTDDHGAAATTDISITLTGTNDAPKITSVIAPVTVAEDSAIITGTVISSDVDDNATANYTAPITAGFTITDAETGAYSFDPSDDAYQYLAEGETLMVTIPVTVTDGEGATATTDVVINLVGTNDAPTISVETINIDEDSTISGQITFADADGTASIAVAPNAALPTGFTLNTEGSYVFNTNGTSYQHLAQGNTQQIIIPVVVTDTQGSATSSNIIINITGTNDTPEIDAIASVNADEDSTVITGTVTSSDVDDNSTATYTAPITAGFTINAQTGVYSFDPSDDAYQSLAEGVPLVVTIPVTVTDDKGKTATTNVVINLVGTNDAPVVETPIEDDTVAQNVAYTYNASVNFSDPDGDGLTYSATLENGDPLPTWLSITTAGVLSGTPANADVGEINVTVTATDGIASKSDTYVLTVSNVNDAPVVETLIEDDTVAQNVAYTYNASVNFSDPDGDGLTYSATLENGDPLPTWLSITTAGVLSGTPANADVGEINVTVTATDGIASKSDTYVLTVSNVNDAPVVETLIEDDTVAQNVAYTYNASVNFSDPDGDGLTYSATLENGDPLPTWLSITTAGVLSGTPANADVGEINVTVTATDGIASKSDTYVLTVSNVNDAPVVETLIEDDTVAQNVAYTYNASVNFSDPDGDGLTYSATLENGDPLPTWLSITTAGVLSGTPANADVGEINVTVTATDGIASKSDTYVLTVSNVNDAPVVETLIEDDTVAQNVAYTYNASVNFSDPDGDGLTYSATLENGDPLPTWLSITTAGVLSGTPANADVGEINVTVTATDGIASKSDTYVLTVSNVNDAPVVETLIEDDTVAQNVAYTYNASVNFSDPDGDGLTYSATLENGDPLPTWLSITTAGVLSGTPANADVGEINVTVTATDGIASKSDTYVLTVSNVNDAPVVETLIEDDTVAQNVAYTYNASVNFSDPDGDGLTYSATLENGDPLPTWLSITTAGVLSGTPANADVGEINVTVTATDGIASKSDTYTLSVTPEIVVTQNETFTFTDNTYTTQMITSFDKLNDVIDNSSSKNQTIILKTSNVDTYNSGTTYSHTINLGEGTKDKVIFDTNEDIIFQGSEDGGMNDTEYRFLNIENYEVIQVGNLTGSDLDNAITLQSNNFTNINLAGGNDRLIIDDNLSIDLSNIHNVENITLGTDAALIGSGASSSVTAADLFEDNDIVIISDHDHADDGNTDPDIVLNSGTFTRSNITTEIDGNSYYTYTDNANHTVQIEATIDVTWQ